MENTKTFIKESSNLPKDFFICEAAGLKWLKTPGGPRIAKVIDAGDKYLRLEKIQVTSSTRDAARDFGKSLANMHQAGAKYFGAAPDNWNKDGYFGPLSDPLQMLNYKGENAADYYYNGRLLPMLALGEKRGVFSDYDRDLTIEFGGRLAEILEPLENSKPARLHGDLWSGNLLWTSDNGKTEAVLIDPAAHGGCNEEDLAMLKLFGCPYWEDILEAYNKVLPLKKGFQERITLWQLYPISGHAVFFGGGYISQYRSMLKMYL